jgi:predicted glycosyltransferase
MRLPMRLIAGPFLPEAQWLTLQQAVRGIDGIQLLRQVPDMVDEMRTSRVSISQCGYNTSLDIVVSGVPALVVPYETPSENEQVERATRMAQLGAMLHLSEPGLDALRLSEEIVTLLAFRPQIAALNLDGACCSAQILQRMCVDSLGSQGRRIAA